jgi:hypothetical protein
MGLKNATHKPLVFQDLSNERPNSNMDVNQQLKEKFKALKYKTMNVNSAPSVPRSISPDGVNLNSRFFREKDEGLQHHKLF